MRAFGHRVRALCPQRELADMFRGLFAGNCAITVERALGGEVPDSPRDVLYFTIQEAVPFQWSPYSG